MYPVIFNAMRPSNMKRKSRQKSNYYRKNSALCHRELLNFYMITCYNNSISIPRECASNRSWHNTDVGFSDVGEIYTGIYCNCNCGFSTDL